MDFFEKLDVTVGIAIDELWESPQDGKFPTSFLRSIAVEIGYPDFSHPLDSDGQPNLIFRAEGVRSPHGEEQHKKQAELMLWRRDNKDDVFAVSFLKLTAPLPGWNVDEVFIRTTFAFDPDDPRAALPTGGSTHVSEKRTSDHLVRISFGDI
jgi:hypothetical protein